VCNERNTGEKKRVLRDSEFLIPVVDFAPQCYQPSNAYGCNSIKHNHVTIARVSNRPQYPSENTNKYYKVPVNAAALNYWYFVLADLGFSP
jgi:hypothetical protein